MTLSVYLVGIGSFVGLILLLTVLILVANKYLADYGTCKVLINTEEPFEVEGGDTLLSALYAQKIFIPSGCGGQATCGLCKCKVLSGGGQILPTELQFLDRAEQLTGTRIACQVKIKQDIKIKIPEEYLKVQEFKAVVERNEKVTYDMADLRFKLIEPDNIEFKPGQFVQVRIPDPDSPDGTAFRAYSIASKPSDNHAVELVVRLVPGGKGSTYLHNVKEGEEVVFTGPYGEFEFIDDADYHFMMVGGGAGMAPMKSLIQHILEVTPEREMELYFGCRDVPDIFYKEWYEELSKEHPNFKVMFALSDLTEENKAEKSWDGATGFIHLHVDKNYNPPEKRQVFLCGPPPMIDAVMKVLFENKGLKEEEVFYDKF